MPKINLKFRDLRNLVLFAQFKKDENNHGGVLLLVKLQASARNFTKSNKHTSMGDFNIFKIV